MTPERWREVRAAFDAVAALAPGERASTLAALDRRDAELAGEVRALLAAEERDARFLAAEATSTDAAAARDRRGERVGPWELLSPLGEGGMGRVFLARRADRSFDKRVAVKFVHAELLSPWLRERFAAERQALAALEHPGIARLLDGGESAAGEPFLALEYVEGRQLLRFADEAALDRRARVRLFLQVVDAVAHAHRHLVVHRDLKPGNILVTDAGEAKLLDFGIAKILAPASDAGAAETRTFLRALTPEYASPEQILGGATTTATDVYSLGVVLYELLTGRRPYKVPTGAAEEWAEAALHQEATRARELGGDLEAIVIRALRKAPVERYPTADAFADDLRRLLDGRPVVARRGSVAYRAAKFVRRHAAGVAAATLAVAALVVAALISLEQAKVARAERDRARLESARANESAAFLASLFENADPGRTRGAKTTVRDVLDRGARRIESDLAGQPEVQVKLLALVGSVYRELGLLEPGRAANRRALAIAESSLGAGSLATAQALHELGALERVAGNFGEARALAERALAIRERALGSRHIDVARTLALLATVDRIEGKGKEGTARYDRALAIAAEGGVETTEVGKWLNNRGLIYQDQGELEPARAAFERSIAVLEKNEGPESPLLALALDNLGMVQRALADYDAALVSLERGRELVEAGWGREHPQYGTALNSLGNVYLETGRYAEARDRFRASAANYEAALGKDHAALAWPLDNEGLALLGLGRPAEALPLFARALVLREAAYGGDHWEVATSRSDLGRALSALDDPRAEAELRGSVELARRVIVPPTLALADIVLPFADHLAAKGRDAEAVPLYAEALGLYRAGFPAEHPKIAEVERKLAAAGAKARG